MDRLTPETEQNIFIMIHNPLSIICASRIWYNISRNHTTRAKWLIFYHGRSHALFNAVKKGPKFLTYDQLEALFSLNILPSRYFVQRLMLAFGQVDCDLVDMKIRNEILDHDISLMGKTKSSWAEDIDFNVLNCILMKAHELYGYGDIITDTNDLVLQGQFLLCYPPGSTFDCGIDIIFDKVNYLYKLGYRLNIPLFSEIVLLFMKFIDSIGNDILQICSKLMNRTAED
ncbi:8932_t:CDS:2, partial [Racocetra persica]